MFLFKKNLIFSTLLPTTPHKNWLLCTLVKGGGGGEGGGIQFVTYFPTLDWGVTKLTSILVVDLMSLAQLAFNNVKLHLINRYSIVILFYKK